MEKLKNLSISLFWIVISLVCLTKVDFRAIVDLIPISFSKNNPINYDDAVKNIEKQFSRQIGNSRDVYLIKQGASYQDKTIVIFGFLNDMEVCQGLVEGMQRTPEVFGANANQIYNCIYAN